MKTKWILLASLTFLIVSCGTGAGAAPGENGTRLSSQGKESQTAEPQAGALTPTQVIIGDEAVPGTRVPPPYADQASEGVKLARQDLAQRLKVSVDGISVAAVLGQEFSDNAFYCRTSKDRIAKDDAPAVISGFSILLRASGQRYEYHASGQTVIFCRPLP